MYLQLCVSFGFPRLAGYDGAGERMVWSHNLVVIIVKMKKFLERKRNESLESLLTTRLVSRVLQDLTAAMWCNT
jgi:hypothetical protein